jgi:hypothetical protein
MNSLRKAVIAAVILGVGFAGFGIGFVQAQTSAPAQAPQASPAPTAAASPNAAPKPDVPAFHAVAPHGALPETLDPKQFSDAETQNLYALAAKEKSVLYQLPCYCRCDKEVGHKSLLDCYVDEHAAHCVLCKKEAAFAYAETQAGKTAAQIRKEIMDGKWKQVDLSQYDTLEPTK